jgi:hypothetical protein
MTTVEYDKITVREKTTSPIKMVAKADGNPINMVGVYQLEFRMVDKFGKTYLYRSNTVEEDYNLEPVEIVDRLTGVIHFHPPDENVFLYSRSPYKVYIRVWETDTINYSVPESTYNIIEVLKEY